MGAPVAPYLAKVYVRDEGALRRRYEVIHRRLPPGVRRVLPDPFTFSWRRRMASVALAELGTNAVGVLPLIAQAIDSQALHDSLYVLEKCAPGTSFESNAVNLVLQRSVSPFSSQSGLAYRAMGAFTNHPALLIPALVKGLSSPVGPREDAFGSLQRFGKAAVPALTEAALKENNSTGFVMGVLESIDAESAVRVRAELAALKEARTR
jgi:hypothetical protein